MDADLSKADAHYRARDRLYRAMPQSMHADIVREVAASITEAVLDAIGYDALVQSEEADR